MCTLPKWLGAPTDNGGRAGSISDFGWASLTSDRGGHHPNRRHQAVDELPLTE